LELGLRSFSFGDDLKLFIVSQDPKYVVCNQLVGKRYFRKFEHTTPIPDPFLKEKPANGYRIFVLGESTVQGFPYDENISFTRILQRRLQDIFPNRIIEVINLGLTAVNSYTLLDFTDELLQQQPDAVLIYAGHNEYYGALGVASMENGSIPRWLKNLHLNLIHLRTYQLLQKTIAATYKMIHSSTQVSIQGTLMERMVGKNLIPYGSPMYLDGLEQFNNNAIKLFAKLKRAGVPIIVSDLVSNEKDLPPFRSIRYNEYPPADSVYFNARLLEITQRFSEAKEEYLRAKDLDVIRFRASEDINKRIAALADSMAISRISLKSLFERNSPHAIVGNNLMTEHLHPNVDGYFLMAEGFFQALKEHKFIDQQWDTTRIQPWTYYRQNWGFTELDSMIAVVRIKRLRAGWPFQPEASANNFFLTYTPKGIVDSLAFLSVKYNNISSEMVHKQLAEHYESLGDFKRASKEYLSIAYTTPSNALAYYYAADFASKAKDYTSAIRYLRESPNSDTSSHAQFILASLYLSQRDFREALHCIDKLQKPLAGEDNYFQVQKLKYRILKDSGLVDEAAKTLALLRKINPSFQESGSASVVSIFVPNAIKPYIDRSEALRKSGRFSQSLEVLLEANTIQETAYTDLLIGKILFTQKNLRALSYLEKAQKEIKEDPSLSFSLCTLYLLKGDTYKAKAALDEYTMLQGKNDPQVLRLKAAYEKKAKEKKGISVVSFQLPYCSFCCISENISPLILF